MGCRIGITTNEAERKQYWERVHPTLRNWEILSRHRSKSAAQHQENLLAEKHGCDASPGGDDSDIDDIWVVYYFAY